MDSQPQSPLAVGSHVFKSRLIFGSGGMRSIAALRIALANTQSELTTVAMRRYDPAASGRLFDVLREFNQQILPNTAGCYNATEAVITAELAREALETNLIKVEVINDDSTLLPDPIETLKATEVLTNKGFEVMAYISDDVVLARRIEQAGAKAVMPLGAPIGSGMGILNPFNIETIVNFANVPIILDAGLGSASDAALAMELGCDGVLAASAINRAEDPAIMAEAFRLGVIAGHLSRRAGRIPKSTRAIASTAISGKAQFEVSSNN
ncbi:MAG: thiazole synthase [Actinomycetota bacterium]|nr:thiazole synthase [Actinomycetota bacterium]